ncbi:MAG TPA: hypothetical protein VIS99_03625 [Terrimicrobiaceae bacterium]
MSTLSIGNSMAHSGIAMAKAATESSGDSVLRYSTAVGGRAARVKGFGGAFCSERTLRRLRGFLVEDRGREFKVGFVSEGEPEGKVILYFLPADLLRHAGVTTENQQFELDEKVTKFRDGSVAVTYHVRPNAPAYEGFVDPLDLDEDHREKLTVLLRNLGRAEV